MLPFEAGGDVVLEFVLNTYAPVSYITSEARDMLLRLGFATSLGEETCIVPDLSVQRQPLAAQQFRVRRGAFRGVDGMIGLDFLGRFTDVHFNLPSLRLSLWNS
jgi:hypothetical protein